MGYGGNDRCRPTLIQSMQLRKSTGPVDFHVLRSRAIDDARVKEYNFDWCFIGLIHPNHFKLFICLYRHHPPFSASKYRDDIYVMYYGL